MHINIYKYGSYRYQKYIPRWMGNRIILVVTGLKEWENISEPQELVNNLGKNTGTDKVFPNW